LDLLNTESFLKRHEHGCARKGNEVKIVLIGAGSHSFGRGQIVDILRSADLRGRDVEVVLVDENEAALDTMTRLAKRIAEHVGSDTRLSSNTDRVPALVGADYVITAVERRRMELWEQDFRVPLSYGFKHCLGENGGPGALFHALRTIDLVVPICKDMERLCPDAWLFNFTNPEMRVLHAVLHLTKIRAAGFCHGVLGALEAIPRYLGRPLDELDIVSAGLNHFYCVTQIRDKTTGEDLYPKVLQKVADDKDTPHALFKKIADIFGVFTFPSDDHIGEYLSFGSDYMGVKWGYGLESKRLKGVDDPPSHVPIEDYASGDIPLDDEITRPTGEYTVPVICDIELDRGSARPAVNVLNTERYIENLPTGAAVEVPATVDADGIHPVNVGPIPESFAAFMRTQISIVELTTEAYRTRDRKLLLQALLLDPNVNSISGAESMLDDMLTLQEDFLPEF
jgi:alpha-galactosidase